MTRWIVLVVLAAAGHVLLTWGWLMLDALGDPIGGTTALWYSLLQSPLVSAYAVIPGFALGFFTRRGLLLGAACGAIAGPIEHLVILAQWIDLDISLGLLAKLASSAVGGAIASAVAGGAGELLSSKVGSNNSFKPSPLRGPA